MTSSKRAWSGVPSAGGGLIATVLLMLVAMMIASTGETRSGNTFEFRPGVVVDPERATVYLMTPGPGIDALDLASGKSLWRTDQAARPLARYEDLLVAQTEPTVGRQFLRIALLSTRDVAASPRFVDIRLPADVQPTVDDRMESSFSAAARVQGGAVVLSWAYAYERVTGPPPGPDETRFEAAGSVRIDMHTGQIVPLDEKAVLPEPELPPAVRRLKDAGALPGDVWRVDGVLVAIERATHEGRQRVTLKRWDPKTGEALADVTLFDGGLSFRSVSADRRHLLASRRHASDSRFWAWVVYSLETGAKVAELRHDEPGARFFVHGSRLIHETNVVHRLVEGQVVVEPKKVRALDLETGAEVWSRTTRDTKYRGPYPPRTAR